MRILVRVSTNSDQSNVEKITEMEYKIRVCAKPQAGKANAEVCRLLANYFGVSPSDVHVMRGASQHRKTIQIDGI